MHAYVPDWNRGMNLLCHMICQFVSIFALFACFFCYYQDDAAVQFPGRVFFITVAALLLVRILWCRFYLPFVMLVMHIFRFEHVRWNRAPRSLGAV